MSESSIREYKSIRKIRRGSADFNSLAQTCVCLANAQGGEIIIGIEDKDKLPPLNQTVDIKEVNETINKLRTRAFNVSLANPEIYTHENGSQYFSFKILPSMTAIATTSDGKIYIRIGDKCHPARNEDIIHLVSEKNAFQWELIIHEDIHIKDINPDEVHYFNNSVRKSVKVNDFVKNKTDTEILEHYNLTDNKGCLTNLGLLWLGFPRQRARVSYPLTVQYIVYNDLDAKIRKETWFDNQLNPKELLMDIEKEAVELTYFHEFPDGLFRKQIRHYAPEVIRELLVNAFAHKSYTISSDIFIEVWPDRMTVTSPGGLPLGITKENILHERHRRNPHLINIFHDLGLMEGEGSGYDLIYEKLSRDSKAYPEIESSYNKVSISLYSKVIDENSLKIIDYVSKHYELSQKEFITLGIIARNKKILSTQLYKELQLSGEERLRGWIGKLLKKGIIISRGQKKGTAYIVNPKLISNARLNIKASLKTIELHRLKALIIEDLELNPGSSIRQIHKRLEDINFQDVQKAVYALADEGILIPEGNKRYRTYRVAKKK